MKIKTAKLDYDQVLALPKEKRLKPRRPSALLKKVVQVASKGDLKATNFTYKEYGMEKLEKDSPCLILMNHSSFIDLKIVSHIFKDRPYNIVCTSDGFVGKNGLMNKLGCIPAKKFVTDVALLKDMKYTVDKLGCSILMYPEASYSFDGTATPLPDSVGKCVKLLGVPVIMIRTYGAFARDPLYNNLQLRKVDVSADVTYLLGPDEIKGMSVEDINEVLAKQFDFDNFKWQQENGVMVSEPFRADHLNRVLYKCPHCMTEGKMEGKGITISCKACGKTYELTEQGSLAAVDGDHRFSHVPDWYAWERQCVSKELRDGSYALCIPVDICMLVDSKCVYEVGDGWLTHDKDGFHLVGCDGRLDYKQSPKASYSLYADYYWYEIGDMICIGNTDVLYYCFPKVEGDFVAKTRLATEELYKMC